VWERPLGSAAPCSFCFSLLNPPCPRSRFSPLVSLFCPSSIASRRRLLSTAFPLPSPHLYLRFSHHSHSLGISIQPIYRNPFILYGFQFTSFLPLRATFFQAAPTVKPPPPYHSKPTQPSCPIIRPGRHSFETQHHLFPYFIRSFFLVLLRVRRIPTLPSPRGVDLDNRLSTPPARRGSIRSSFYVKGRIPLFRTTHNTQAPDSTRAYNGDRRGQARVQAGVQGRVS
jgi:hypothetical protein